MQGIAGHHGGDLDHYCGHGVDRGIDGGGYRNCDLGDVDVVVHVAVYVDDGDGGDRGWWCRWRRWCLYDKMPTHVSTVSHVYPTRDDSMFEWVLPTFIFRVGNAYTLE